MAGWWPRLWSAKEQDLMFEDRLTDAPERLLIDGPRQVHPDDLCPEGEGERS